MSLFRSNIERMAPYTPGEQPAAGAKVIKLNTNENPYPPSPRVVEAIQAELHQGEAPGSWLRRYSDPRAMDLRQAASAWTGLPVEQILHGNGSDECLTMMVRAFVNDGETIAYPYPTYVLYETLAHTVNARVITHDLNPDCSLPEALFGCEAKLVFVANPNSPLGNSYPLDSLSRLADSLRDGLLVIDEAYAPFAQEHALSLIARHPNVVVLRTFSKSHSLAGMRIGLLFANTEIVAGLWKVKDSYNLDRLAIVAGAASLRDTGWLADNTQKILKTRQRLCEGLHRLGLKTIPTQANFVFARMRSSEQARGAYRYLKDRGILIRYFNERLLDDGIRITVGTDTEIDTFLETLRAYLNG